MLVTSEDYYRHRVGNTVFFASQIDPWLAHRCFQQVCRFKSTLTAGQIIIGRILLIPALHGN